jgi:hypothetical protein
MLLDAPHATGEHVEKVLKSRTLLPFYVLLLFAFTIALYEADHVSTAKLEPDPASASSARGGPSGKVAAPEQRAGELPEHPAAGTKEKRAGGPIRNPDAPSKH